MTIAAPPLKNFKVEANFTLEATDINDALERIATHLLNVSLGHETHIITSGSIEVYPLYLDDGLLKEGVEA